MKSPSIRREWIEMVMEIERLARGDSLPPYGGSGLKFESLNMYKLDTMVSLHTEGVD